MAEQTKGLLARAYERLTQPSRGEEVKAGLLTVRERKELERQRRLEAKGEELARIRARETLLPSRRPLTGLGAADVGLNTVMTAPQSLLGMFAGGLAGGLYGGAQQTGEAMRGEIDLQDPRQTVRAGSQALNVMSGGLLSPVKGTALGSGPLLTLMGIKQPAPRYFSGVEKTIKATKQALTPEQWLRRLRGAKDVKEEVIQWLEVPGFLHGNAGKGRKSIHPNELLAHIEPRKAVLERRTYGYDPAAPATTIDRSPVRPEEIAEVERQLQRPAQAPAEGLWDVHNPHSTGRPVEPPIQQSLHAALEEPYLPGSRVTPMEQIWNDYGYVDLEPSRSGYTAPQTTSLLSRLENRPGRPPAMRQEALEEAALALRPKERRELPTQYEHGGRYTYATPAGGKNYREVVLKLKDIHEQGPDQRRRRAGNSPYLNRPYSSSHWRDDPNTLLANRYDDRVLDRQRTLALQESQSDIHQAARWRGYLEPQPDAVLRKQAQSLMDTRYPGRYARKFTEYSPQEQTRIMERIRNDYPPIGTDMPLKDQKAWAALSAKDALREAAEGQYPQIAWTHSSQQVGRWQGHEKGFQQHYDEFLKGQMESLTGGKAKLVVKGKDHLGNDLKWWVIPLTDKMRTKFLDEGFSLFARGVPVPVGQEQRREPRPHGRTMGGGLLGIGQP